MGIISVSLPNDGDTIDVADYNTPITTIVNEINGEIDNSNIAAAAAIAGSKLASGGVGTTQLADGSVTTAKIADANVTSEKLDATIACRAYLNQAQNLSSEAKILLNAENFDTGSDFDTTNSRFVVPVTGYYQVSAAIRVSNLDANGALICSIFVNGSVYTRGASFSTSAADDPSSVINSLVFATAGQYIELYGLASTSEALTTGSDWCFMSIYCIGV